jgi:hypothetical protein
MMLQEIRMCAKPRLAQTRGPVSAVRNLDLEKYQYTCPFGIADRNRRQSAPSRPAHWRIVA